MRNVVLSSSVYSERALATLVSLAEAGHTPVACLCISTVNWRYLVRKLGQYGIMNFVRYALRRLGLMRASGGEEGSASSAFENPYTQARLEKAGKSFKKLSEACEAYKVPMIFCGDMHEPGALKRLKALSPDLGIYTGGGILRKPLIETFKIGILNAHAGVLPNYRGMSVMEWAVLTGGETGLTVHFIDPGIDTGNIFLVRKMQPAPQDHSLAEFRFRLSDATVDALVEVTDLIAKQNLQPARQSLKEGKQYFVMHQRLLELAERRLRMPAANAPRADG